MDTNLKLMPRPLMESVETTLENAKAKGFQTVIIIGFTGNKSEISSSSWRLNRMEMLGALEYAKQHVWEA